MVDDGNGDGDGETGLLDATSLAAAAAAAAEMTGNGETDLHIDSTLFALSEAVKEAQQESARYAENLVKHENELEADVQAQAQVHVQVSHDQEGVPPALQLDEQGQVPLNAAGGQPQEHVVEDGTGTIHLDDDGIDPALREIVNSLTAQQVSVVEVVATSLRRYWNLRLASRVIGIGIGISESIVLISRPISPPSPSHMHRECPTRKPPPSSRRTSPGTNTTCKRTLMERWTISPSRALVRCVAV